MRFAVEFEQQGSELHLRYSPRDDDSWVHARFKRGEDLLIKGTFLFRQEHLIPEEPLDMADDELGFVDSEPLRFRVAVLDGDYFSFDPEILSISYPLLIHRQAPITWKWFAAEQRTSIFSLIAEIRPRQIVIGGDKPDAIPVAEFEKLIFNFPTRLELKRYTLARIGAVVREYSDTQVDAELLYRNYVSKRLDKKTRDIVGLFREEEKRKYHYLHERLTAMLAAENTYNETKWQDEILQIIQLLNPKYIRAIKEAPVRGDVHNDIRKIDILLVDASGNVDVIEIKKPFDKCIVTEGDYRKNHIPLRELSGSVMQIEKYLYYLNRWGIEGETRLTEKYQQQLPQGFSIKITNPSGIIIMGRDKNLTDAQRRDFEVVKRKYKHIADIITYDDLLRRLEFVLKQFGSNV
jgi:hypothetical protein